MPKNMPVNETDVSADPLQGRRRRLRLTEMPSSMDVFSAVDAAFVYYPPLEAVGMSAEALSWKLQHWHGESKEIADEAAAYYLKYFAQLDVALWLEESSEAFGIFCDEKWDFDWTGTLPVGDAHKCPEDISISALLRADESDAATKIPNLLPPADTVASPEEIAAALMKTLCAHLDNTLDAFKDRIERERRSASKALLVCAAAFRQQCTERGMEIISMTCSF